MTTSFFSSAKCLSFFIFFPSFSAPPWKERLYHTPYGRAPCSESLQYIGVVWNKQRVSHKQSLIDIVLSFANCTTVHARTCSKYATWSFVVRFLSWYLGVKMKCWNVLVFASMYVGAGVCLCGCAVQFGKVTVGRIQQHGNHLFLSLSSSARVCVSERVWGGQGMYERVTRWKSNQKELKRERRACGGAEMRLA